jgi:hypothetical protein
VTGGEQCGGRHARTPTSDEARKALQSDAQPVRATIGDVPLGAHRYPVGTMTSCDERKNRQERRFTEDYFLRWRIFERMRRFLRPCFRRPFPDFLVPKAISELTNI